MLGMLGMLGMLDMLWMLGMLGMLDMLWMLGMLGMLDMLGKLWMLSMLGNLQYSKCRKIWFCIKLNISKKKIQSSWIICLDLRATGDTFRVSIVTPL